MFDMMKFNGETVNVSDFNETFDVSQIHGVLPVRKDYTNGYIVDENEPTGKILILRANGKDYVMYFENSVETSQLVDLL